MINTTINPIVFSDSLKIEAILLIIKPRALECFKKNKKDMKIKMSKKPKVKLTDEDGNAFAIMARVRKALRENRQVDKVKEFTDEATSGDYDHLIQTCFKYVDVE